MRWNVSFEFDTKFEAFVHIKMTQCQFAKVLFSI